MMPVAGLIDRKETETVLEATSRNFNECVAKNITDSAAQSMGPTNTMVGGMTTLLSDLSDSLNAARQASSTLRSGISDATADVMDRTVGVTVPIHQMMLSVKDSFGKMQGILAASLFTMMGTYDTLKALMGAILGLVIKTLIVFSAVIVGLWANPATWPVASAMSVVYLGISVPLALIATFMSNTLHIKTDEIPKLRCFHPATILDGGTTRADSIRIGDRLLDVVGADGQVHENYVTETMVLLGRDTVMYNLFDNQITGTHLVWHEGEGAWIRVESHPDAILLHDSPASAMYVYCINTTTGKIVLNNGVYATDWSERVLLSPHTLQAKQTMGYDAYDLIGQNKEKVGTVWGIVHLAKGKIHLMSTSGNIICNGKLVPDYEHE
jgi:hypothetical protein